MLIKDLLPFASQLRLAGSNVDDPDRVSLRSLRDAVQGKFGEPSRSQAMAQLVESDFPNKARELQLVLEDGEASPEVRYLAAIHLGMINSPEAIQILVENTRLSDDCLLSGVLLSLRRIGNEAALAAIGSVQREASEPIRHEASVAAAFIAHRLGLPGHGWLAPPHGEERPKPLSQPSCAQRTLRLCQAHAADAELCLRSLARRPYAIELLEKPMFELRCEHQIWMIVFTRIFADCDLSDFLARKSSLLAIIARRDPINHLHNAAYALFTSPDSEEGSSRVALHLCGVDGDRMASGHLSLQGECHAFTLTSSDNQRHFHLEVEGSLSQTQLTFTRAYTVRNAKRRPVTEERQPVQG